MEGSAMRTSGEGGKNRAGQRGAVILVVMLLVIMFTGLGLLAMRHTRLELRSTGAYLDASQAAALADGALAIVATDLRLSSDYYQFMFTNSEHDGMSVDGGMEEYEIPISEELQLTSGDAGPATDGIIPQLSGTLASNAELGAIYGTEAVTRVKHTIPALAPCPPGYSCNDEQNYAWYYFLVNATAEFGPRVASDPEHPLYESGRARARGRVMVGPIAAYGR
jgi:hypothetical protein